MIFGIMGLENILKLASAAKPIDISSFIRIEHLVIIHLTLGKLIDEITATFYGNPTCSLTTP
jgi:hypothetical protein